MQLLDTHPWIVEGDVAGSGVIFELDAAACGDGIPPKLQQLIARHPIPLAGGRESVEQDKLMIWCCGRGCSYTLSTDPFHKLAPPAL